MTAVDRLDRDEILAQRFRDRCLPTRAEQRVFDSDPVFRASLMLMQRTFIATDAALKAEGLDEAARDRVAYRLLYDEEPRSYPVPDFREGLERMQARQAEILRLMDAPPKPFPIPPEWKP